MAKILLVEDDQSLREIYGIRLTAEGYEIVSAEDGEEALATAVREKPDLIISDVMMPKISGFDMLDILRSTPETKDIKVIMMTALSSEDQRERGEALGANRFLVKSQVGIEDVVNAVHEVLDQPTTQNPVQAAKTPQLERAMQSAGMPQTVGTSQPVGMPQSTGILQDSGVSQPTRTPQSAAQLGQLTTQDPQSLEQHESMSTNVSPASGYESLKAPDSYTVDTVTDNSGMNIKDQMDQILGGMGSV